MQNLFVNVQNILYTLTLPYLVNRYHKYILYIYIFIRNKTLHKTAGLFYRVYVREPYTFHNFEEDREKLKSVVPAYEIQKREKKNLKIILLNYNANEAMKRKNPLPPFL